MREELAALMHGIWCGWRCYVVARSTFNSDGTMTTPAWAVKRWGRQINTPYDELSEKEKDSDRHQADKVLELFARRLLIPNTVIERNPVPEIMERVAEACYAMTDGNELIPVDVVVRWLAYIEDGTDCEEA